MTRHTGPWPAGTPCWVDLSVPDTAVAQGFYGDLLGWGFSDTGAEYGGYLIAHRDAAPVAGIGPLPQPELPSMWTVYFASDDADATATAVTRAGGSVLVAPGDVGDLGRMCIALDPAGAVFGVWQAGTHAGAGLRAEPGGLAWEDLRSTDPALARPFYTEVFGHLTRPMPGGGADYGTFELEEGLPLGGIGGMMGAEGTPSHWVAYFAVEDADDARSTAAAKGGRVLVETFDSPYGRMAGLADPFGAPFWAVQA